MADLAGLLASVLANPGDDLPRLVYADALEESGQEERAKFIRGQIERHGTPAAEKELDRLGLGATVYGWDAELKDTGIGFAYSRGFVSEIWCGLQSWFDEGWELVRRYPVERVMITDKRPSHDDRWYVDGDVGPDEATLPRRLYGLVRGQSFSGRKSFRDESAAERALSDACLAFARRQFVELSQPPEMGELIPLMRPHEVLR